MVSSARIGICTDTPSCAPWPPSPRRSAYPCLLVKIDVRIVRHERHQEAFELRALYHAVLLDIIYLEGDCGPEWMGRAGDVHKMHRWKKPAPGSFSDGGGGTRGGSGGVILQPPSQCDLWLLALHIVSQGPLLIGRLSAAATPAGQQHAAIGSRGGRRAASPPLSIAPGQKQRLTACLVLQRRLGVEDRERADELPKIDHMVLLNVEKLKDLTHGKRGKRGQA